jgi:tellurite resistance protein TerC
MFGIIEIQWWHWVAFLALVLVLLGLDLGVFHREARVISFREALGWTSVWFSLAMAFALFLRPLRGREESLEFLTGYIIELSLSMDNVFVIAMVFQYFKVPAAYQHRVLFWGILGALIMRGLMIWLGSELINNYHWVLYLFGVFLVLTGIKMLIGDQEEIEPEKNPVLKLARRFFPVSPSFEGQKFMTVYRGHRALTPLALVLLMVETTDLIFALDSIPAIFAVTTKPFIVFTSNVFAILGLRSLYFVLAGAIAFFSYLKYGLAIVLVFIGVKMLLMDFFHIPIGISLSIVAGVILTSIVVSIIAGQRASSRAPEADSSER